MANYFETMIKGSDVKLAVSWLTTELLGRLNAKGVELGESGIDAFEACSPHKENS